MDDDLATGNDAGVGDGEELVVNGLNSQTEEADEMSTPMNDGPVYREQLRTNEMPTDGPTRIQGENAAATEDPSMDPIMTGIPVTVTTHSPPSPAQISRDSIDDTVVVAPAQASTIAQNITAIPPPAYSNIDEAPSHSPERFNAGVVPPSPPALTSPRISFDEYLSLSELSFEWADSYDDKDWKRLEKILAPTLKVDYTSVNGHKWDALPASEFISIMSHVGFVGDPLVHTQHHIGASKWQKLSDEEVVGHHQLRAAHQRYTGLDRKTVESKGHGHAMVRHWYRKVGGEWKLAGLMPKVRWNEFEFEKVFRGF